MSDTRESLTLFTPLPPERNGIADYAVALLGGLRSHYDCRAACADWLGTAPPGVAVLDAALAHRHAGRRTLHQLGNNPGHRFVLQALRRLPGVTTLHDPGLLHLYESAGEEAAAIRAGLADALPAIAATFGRQDRDHGLRTRANHLLFDMVGETLARSRAVVVHSAFARNRLALVHGAAATAHVVVIPHLLPPGPGSGLGPLPDRAAARARLGVPPGAFLVVTAGFATRAKRFDWVIEALEAAIDAGAELRWIHAGAERPEEFALRHAIAARPRLAGRAAIAGYLDEAALGDHLAAADVLLNLRFPSAGESSGSLARAFAAGTCCVVSDTAGYAELPRDAVLQIPLAGAVAVLTQALVALARDPGQAATIGARGRRHALATMGLDAVARSYRDVIEASLDRPGRHEPFAAALPPPLVLAATAALTPGDVAAVLAGRQGRVRLRLAVPDLAALADLTLDQPGWLAALLPPAARLHGTRVEAGAQPGLLLDLALGWPA